MNVMSLDLIYANPDQPRREFSERKLEEGRAGTYNKLRALVNSLLVAQAQLSYPGFTKPSGQGGSSWQRINSNTHIRFGQEVL
jgi:hypothetical protein